jgi:hypothetical protein
MKRLFLLSLLMVAAGCSNASDLEPDLTTLSSPKPMTGSMMATGTPFPTLTPIPTITQSIAPTTAQTHIPSCDPLLEEYCVYPYAGTLQPPFFAPDRYYLDQFYDYGSTDFGARMPHHGVDYDNPTGTQVYASADGEVVYVGTDHDRLFSPWPDFYGNLILLEHAGGGESFYTLYAHLSQIEVDEGDFVFAGEPIGKVGSSGSAIGGHLHLEVRRDEYNYTQTRNPELWLAPYETDGVRSGYLAARIVNRQRQLEHVDLTIEFYNFRDGTAPAVWEASYETYLFDKHPVGQDARWGENFAQGGLWPGYYKITVLKDDLAYERWVEVLPEHLTYFVWVID